MWFTTVLNALVGCQQAVPEDVWFEEDAQVIVVSVCPKARARRRCGVRRARCPRFDAGVGRRRRRHLDAAVLKLYPKADAPRVACKQHGVVVAAPRARHDAGHTRDFDQQVVRMATECSRSATAQVIRTARRTVGAIVTRRRAEAGIDRLAARARAAPRD